MKLGMCGHGGVPLKFTGAGHLIQEICACPEFALRSLEQTIDRPGVGVWEFQKFRNFRIFWNVCVLGQELFYRVGGRFGDDSSSKCEPFRHGD